jgi:hypothetical protein
LADLNFIHSLGGNWLACSISHLDTNQSSRVFEIRRVLLTSSYIQDMREYCSNIPDSFADFQGMRPTHGSLTSNWQQPPSPRNRFCWVLLLRAKTTCNKDGILGLWSILICSLFNRDAASCITSAVPQTVLWFRWGDRSQSLLKWKGGI